MRVYTAKERDTRMTQLHKTVNAINTGIKAHHIRPTFLMSTANSYKRKPRNWGR